MKFEPGQSVQMKSRPPKTLTVLSVEGETVVVGWDDDDGNEKELPLPADVLWIVDPDSAGPVPVGFFPE